MIDLIVLVADIDAEYTLRGLFSRPQALGTRPFTFEVFRHPHRDPGCLHGSVDFLRAFTNQYRFAIVLFDHEGSGRENTETATLELTLTQQLHNSGWPQRALALVLDPELEIWVWSDSPQVDVALGWTAKQPPLRQWLVQNNWTASQNAKPARPKESMKAALRTVQKAPSASLFHHLASSVSFKRCTDPAFQKLLATLPSWFPLNQGHSP